MATAAPAYGGTGRSCVVCGEPWPHAVACPDCLEDYCTECFYWHRDCPGEIEEEEEVAA